MGPRGRPGWVAGAIGVVMALASASCGSSGNDLIAPSPTVEETTTDAGATTQLEITTTVATTSTTASTEATVEATTTTTTTLAPTTTTSPAIPLVVPGLESAEVRTVCVTVAQTYPEIGQDHEARFEDVLIGALLAMELSTTGPDGLCDAELAFDVVGRALSDVYSTDSGSVTDYSGASVEGTAAFTVTGFEPVQLSVAGRFEPPFMITSEHPGPAEAPYSAAFLEPMLTVLGLVWGPVAAVDTMESWPQGEFFDTLADGGREWIVRHASILLPRLMDMRLSSSYTISERAYQGLASIVVREAVPEADQSAIVRTFIADLTDPYGYSGQALLGILGEVGPSTGGYFTDDAGNITDPWDATRWAEWADAMGY